MLAEGASCLVTIAHTLQLRQREGQQAARIVALAIEAGAETPEDFEEMLGTEPLTDEQLAAGVLPYPPGVGGWFSLALLAPWVPVMSVSRGRAAHLGRLWGLTPARTHTPGSLACGCGLMTLADEQLAVCVCVCVCVVFL